jgi:hypothetical protein
MNFVRIVVIALAVLVAAPAAAQDTSSASIRSVAATPSPWLELPQVLVSEQAVVTCTIGAILGMGAAALTLVDEGRCGAP